MSDHRVLTIIVVNWNAGSQLAEAITSIAQYHSDLVLSVVIVDNASTDDSLLQVEALQNLPYQIQIVRNDKNHGFGSACNQGAAEATGDYLLFLNPDTLLLENALSVPIAFMQDRLNQDVGIVGIQLLDDQNCIARSCSRFPTVRRFAAYALGVNRLPGLRHLDVHMKDWAHDVTQVVDQVIGAFFLIRRNVFDRCEGFDERFFVYFEEVDLTLRAKQLGYSSYFLSEVSAFHKGGGCSVRVKAERLFYSLRSRLLYGFKHFRPWQAWVLVLITLGLEPVTRTFFSLVGSGREGVLNTWRAYGMLWKDLGNILGKGRQ